MRTGVGYMAEGEGLVVGDGWGFVVGLNGS